MNSKQEERLVAAWEGVAQKLGDLNETFQAVIAKQWPEARKTREATITRVPSAEDKIKAQTGNSDGPLEEWLGEFDPDEEIGPREREFLNRGKGQVPPSPKAAT